MKPAAPDMLLIALTTLAETEAPTGARRLAEALSENGFSAAEATAGRLLRQMERMGLTEGLGKQGRVLTHQGKMRLSELRVQQLISKETASVAAAFDVTHEKEMLGLLFARRAIESEAARLAAIYADDAEIAAIKAAAQTCACVDNRWRAAHAKTFHLCVVRASQNSLLSAVGALLLNPEIEPAGRLLLMELSARQGAEEKLSAEHSDIAEAIADRDSEEAERLMRSHIDRMIALAADPVTRSA